LSIFDVPVNEELDDFQASISQYQSSAMSGTSITKVTIGNFDVSHFRSSDIGDRIIGAKNVSSEKWHSEPKPFFSVTVEFAPLDNRADNALSLQMLPLEIIADAQVFVSIVNFFKPPENTESGISDIKVVVNSSGILNIGR
jgi:hypothetical protein